MEKVVENEVEELGKVSVEAMEKTQAQLIEILKEMIKEENKDEQMKFRIKNAVERMNDLEIRLDRIISTYK